MFSIVVDATRRRGACNSGLSSLLFCVVSVNRVCVLTVKGVHATVKLSVITMYFMGRACRGDGFFGSVPLCLVTTSFRRTTLVVYTTEVLVILISPVVRGKGVPI